MLDIRLYMAQRLSALVMVPLVLGHIAVMIYAVQDGLTAQEILNRTRGSLAWAMFYGLFVLAASIHGAIGVRVVTHEWLGASGRTLSNITWLTWLVLFALGAQAVVAVTLT